MADAELFAPTTEQVRMEYVVSGADAPTPRLHLRAEFDRWLAAHDREVAAKALEGAASRIFLHQHPVSIIQQLERRAAALRATPSTKTNGTH